jgi:propanol-preferring alcohol dehydrogenase
MKAWAVDRDRLLVPVDKPVPEPGVGEVLVQVEACGVCRTDLHLAEGDLPAKHPGTTPGHQVVGRVVGGEGVPEGTRVGAAWLRWTCGACRHCLGGMENLCPSSAYNGWDADGGYAEYLAVPAAYVYPLPEGPSAEKLAPLLCAGIVGYRALLRCDLPPGGRLGVYGFGASAHLTAQAAIARGAVVHVVTRSAAARELAVELGAASAGALPPEPLDSAILFAPAGELVLPALEALDRGGTLAVAGIHLTDIPSLNYERHLFQERTLRSVTANTRADGRAYLDLALRHPPHVTTMPYPFAAADRALRDLKNGQVNGAAVLMLS